MSSWYDELRDAHRPTRVRLLLIGESAPDPGTSDQRFFYAPKLDRRDNLFRGVIEALYGHRFPKGSAGVSKARWLDRLRDDGVYLIDLVPFPVNKLSSGERAKARRDHASAAIAASRLINPEGIVVCHAPSFQVLAPALREAGLPLLHDAPIPFPLGPKRAGFVLGVTTATRNLGS